MARHDSRDVTENHRRCRMPLKVELKPGERIIIGECVVTNVDQRTRLLIEGQTPSCARRIF